MMSESIYKEEKASKTSMLKLMEVMAIRDTLTFMKEQQQKTIPCIPTSIKTQGMEGYDYDEAALARLEAKLLYKETDGAEEE